MPHRSTDLPHLAPAPFEELEETSDERFDRSAFARQALDLVRPARTRIAICESGARIRLERGRDWASSSGGGPPHRWALLAIPPKASRRAIALAVAELAERPPPYVLDLLLSNDAAPLAGARDDRDPADRRA